jgi:CelD/BcsL family acetyltransferase involved in cellulose biosynthesis
VDALVDLHGRRFAAAGRLSAFTGERVRRFHRALATALARRGALSLVLLRRGGAPVAAHYGFVHAGRLSHFQGGFDPALSEESPGTALLWTVLEEDVFGAGLLEYDFLDGGEAYKKSFADGRRALFDVTAFRPTALGRARARLATAVSLAKDAARRRLHPQPEAE